MTAPLTPDGSSGHTTNSGQSLGLAGHLHGVPSLANANPTASPAALWVMVVAGVLLITLLGAVFRKVRI